MKYEMVIFDLDGTLWETEEITHQTANAILKKYEADKEISMEVIKKTMGYTFSETAEMYMPYFDVEKREKILSQMLSLNSKILSKFGGNVYEGLEETLYTLKKYYKLAIVSNCDDGYIEAFLESSNLNEYFIDYIPAAKYKISKAEALKQMTERNNIKSAIYVGDTIRDYEAAKEVGIDFIQAKYGYGEDLRNKYSIKKITDLPELLENIEYVFI